MNYNIRILLNLIICLHCSQLFAESKHHKNHRNHKYYNYFGETEPSDQQNQPTVHQYHRQHTISVDDIWNNYQSFRPVLITAPVSTERPPYYLSYDSGIKTKYQAMEEKLIEQQMALQRTGTKGLRNDQDLGTNSGTTQLRFGSTNEIIAQKSRIESQIKEQDELDQSKEVDHTKHNHNIDENPSKPVVNSRRKVGAKGQDGIFGFMSGLHFFRCDRPAFLEKDPDPDGHYLIPENINYYKKCQYYEEDPRRKFQRKVGQLGYNGYYGYYDYGVFVNCPPPKRLESDDDKPGVYYIPNEIGYEPRCQYYSVNISRLYDFESDFDSNTGKITVNIYDNKSIILLPFYLLISTILNYF